MLRKVIASSLAIATLSSVAQPVFPPEAAAKATSPQDVLTAMGVPRPEASTYLLLDAPEIAAPGKVRATVGSEYPGTSMLLLLRAYPERKPAKAAVAGKAPPPTDLLPSLILARQFKPGALAKATVEFDVFTPQVLVLYAYAQGRWFTSAREIKIGRDANSHRQ